MWNNTPGLSKVLKVRDRKGKVMGMASLPITIYSPII